MNGLSLLVVLFWALPCALGQIRFEPVLGAYGDIITLQDEGSAKLFGVEGTGVYVVNKQGKAVGAIGGGLRMMLEGIATADSTEVGVGWRGFSAGMTRSGAGRATLGLFAFLVVSYFAYRYWRQRRVRQPEASGG